jgi:hypothetical protein
MFRSLKDPAPPPGLDAALQELKSLNERVTAADAIARKALSNAAQTAAQTKDQIERIASQIAAAGAGPAFRPPGYSAESAIPRTPSPSVPSQSGGKTVAPSQPLEPSSGENQVVMAYNAAARSRRNSEYIRFESAGQNAAFFTVANARERAQNRDLPPAFRTVETGPYFAVLNPLEQTYSVFPSLGKHPWGLRRDAAMSDVFDFPAVASEPDLGVRKPATFRRDGEDWALIEKGELELL